MERDYFGAYGGISMIKTIAALMFLGMAASANVIGVEFVRCAGKPSEVCALVYTDWTTGQDYQGLELPASIESDAFARSVITDLARSGRTLAMNVEGKILTGGGFADRDNNPYQIQVIDRSDEGPKPRSL